MGDHKVQKVSIDKTPALACKLGDIRFSPKTVKPLGGINPYSEQFDIIGQQFLQILIQHANLQKATRLLDLGCGTGRLTKQLIKFGLRSTYTGIDNNRYFIDYCESSYDTIFKHIDVSHDEYNPSGAIDPCAVTLPVNDQSIDLVVCLGLFNHFHWEWTEHYLSEISRVLAPRGILFSTFILLNDYTIDQINNKMTSRPFQFNTRKDNNWYEFDDRPLLNVALNEVTLRRSLLSKKLIIKEPVRYGQWCNSNNPLSGHDILIAKKNGWGF